MDKTLGLSLVIGAKLGKSFAGTFDTAQQKTTKLGGALAKSRGLKSSITRWKQLKKGVVNAATEMKAAQLRVTTLAREIKATDKPSKTLIRNFEQAKKKSALLKKAHRGQSQQLHKLRGELRGASVDTRKLAASEKVLGRSIDATRRKMDRLNKAQAGKQAAAGRMSALRGRALGALGVAYGATRVVGGAFDLEAKENQLGDVITGKDREARLGASLAHARKFARTSLASEAEVLEIDYALRSSGLDDKAAQFGSEIVSKVATVTKGSASDVGFIIGDTFNTMGKRMEGSVEDRIRRIGDVLTKTKNLFSIKDFNQLGEGLKEGMAGAISNNITLEETAALIGQINNGMLKGSQAGTGLNAMLRQLPKAAGDLGFDIVRDGKGVLDTIATLEGLAEAISSIDDIDEKSMLLQKAFGDEGKKALIPLLDNLGALKANFIEVRDASDGTFDEGYQRRMKKASGQWTMLTQNVGAVGSTLAGTLLPAINMVLKPFVELMGWVAEGIEEFPVIGWAIGTVAAGFVTYAAGLGVVTAAQWLWNAAMLANPIGLIITGVALLAAGAFAVYKNWESVMSWWDAQLEPIYEKITMIGDAWNLIFGDDQPGQKKPSEKTITPVKKTALAVTAAGIIAATSPASASPNVKVVDNSSYQISVTAQPGMNEKQLAKEVMKQIELKQAAKRRAALHDGGDL